MKVKGRDRNDNSTGTDSYAENGNKLTRGSFSGGSNRHAAAAGTADPGVSSRARRCMDRGDNDALFNLMTEGDLIEACIYDGKALRSRYRYYHNMARRMGLRAGDR